MYSKKLLRTFCAIVEHGGFSGAQHALGLSQPAISTHMRMLEEELGYTLCQRGRTGFVLTERGQIAYEKCRRLLTIIEDAEGELRDLRGALKGTLRLGLVDAVLTHEDLPIQAALQAFLGLDHEITLDLRVAAPTELEADLLNNTLQVAIAPFSRRLEGLSYHSLGREEHRLYCGHAHPLFGVAPDIITPDILAAYPLSNRSYQTPIGALSAGEQRQAAWVSNMEAQALLIQTGHFIGTLPVHYAAQFIRRGHMRQLTHPDLVWYSEFSLAMRRTPTRRHMIATFLECLETARAALGRQGKAEEGGEESRA